MTCKKKTPMTGSCAWFSLLHFSWEEQVYIPVNLITPLWYDPYWSRSPNTDALMSHCGVWSTADKQPAKGDMKRQIELKTFNTKIKLIFGCYFREGKKPNKQKSLVLIPYKAKNISKSCQFSPTKAIHICFWILCSCGRRKSRTKCGEWCYTPASIERQVKRETQWQMGSSWRLVFFGFFFEEMNDLTWDLRLSSLTATHQDSTFSEYYHIINPQRLFLSKPRRPENKQQRVSQIEEQLSTKQPASLGTLPLGIPQIRELRRGGVQWWGKVK